MIGGLQPLNAPLPVVPNAGSSTDARNTAQKWRSLLDDSRASRQKFERIWEESINFYNGNHWRTRRPSYRVSHKANFVFSTVETVLPILTDQSPTIKILPRGRQDARSAEIMERVVEYIWSRGNMDEKLVDVCRGGLILGTWAFKVVFDPAILPFGDVRVTAIPPTNLFPDPAATTIENAQWVIHRSMVPISVLLRRYPQAREAIAQASGEKELLRKWTEAAMLNIETESAANSSFVGYQVTGPGSAASTDGVNFVRAPRERIPTSKTVEVLECWHRTDEGLWVTTIIGDQVIQDRPTPYEDQAMPFALFYDYQRLDEFWGRGEPEELIGLQKASNKLMALVIENANLMTNGIWVGTRGTFNADMLTNQPGLVIEVTPGFEWPKRESGAPLPRYVMDAIIELKEDIDRVSGVHDVTQGKKPAGITAGVAIESLQEAAHTRIRLKIRNLEATLTRAGRLIVSRVQQFYTEDRVVRITDAAGQMDFLNVSPEMIQGQFDVEATAGASLASSKAQKFQQGVLMFDKLVNLDPISAVKVLLDQAEFEGKEQLLSTIQQKLAMKERLALMQAMAGGPPAPEGGGPPAVEK
jgi:hypothetical protein